MIYLLIALETIFIFTSYMFNKDGGIDYMASLPAVIYLALAITDVRMKERMLSILILITSIGIAFPRVLNIVGEIKESSRNIGIKNEQMYLDMNKKVAKIQDCYRFSDWQTKAIQECERLNKDERDSAEEHNKNLKYSLERHQKTTMDLQDLAKLLLYCTISIALPTAILIISFGRYKGRDPEEESVESRPNPKEEAFKMYQENIYTIQEIVEKTGVSKSTLYRMLENNGSKKK